MVEETQNTERRKKREKRGKRLRRPWSQLSYTKRVTISFAAIAAMTALVAIGVLSFVWEEHFQAYTSENMQTTASNIAKRITENYIATGEWTDKVLEPAEEVASDARNVAVQVTKINDGKDELPPLYDSTQEGELSGETPTLVPPSKSKTAKIEVDGKFIGEVKVWVLGSNTLLREADQKFRDNSYQGMVFATAIAVILASGIGYLFARNLVRPINRMTSTAKAIKEGDLSARTDLHGDDEIARLGETFDEMATSVEKDRELERRLTTDVAHELRTPLMAIQSTVEAMVDGVFKPDVERLETLNAEVQRLGRLVDALLKLFRLENRSSPAKKEKIDIAEVVAGIVASHQAFVVDSGLTLDYRADDNVFVYGDSDMIRQAVVNLISNSVRYTLEGGRIEVTVKEGDIMASISVCDTGIGLSPEEVKMVFSRFWRADAGRTRESGGLGIGLAVVKEIVDQHGGWVNVEGKTGEGACFTIYIPLYDSERDKKDKLKIRTRSKKE